MNKGKLMFFVSCPKCKRKFGVEPKYIMMYLTRIFENYKTRFKKISEMLTAAQSEIKAQASEKIEKKEGLL
jgi:hypothetical protein